MIVRKNWKKYVYTYERVIKSIQENRMKAKIKKLTWFWCLPRDIEESKIFSEEDYEYLKSL